MAELTSLARPYARAAFEFAKETNAVAEWESFLAAASQVVADEDFTQFLHNPAITFDKKSATLLQIASTESAPTQSPVTQVLDSVREAGIDVDALLAKAQSPRITTGINNFVWQLAENERLALLPAIYAQFNKLKTRELKQVDAYVTSAYPLSQSERVLLQQSLAKSENAVVILHEAIDSSLLGGATIKVGDKFMDGSVRGKLTQLKTQLTA